MPPAPPIPDSPHRGAWPRIAVPLAAATALAPLLLWRTHFAELTWFADDLFLVDQIAQMGFGRWISVVFAENFVPLFKLLWGAVLFGGDGNYQAMIWTLWLTHAVNTWLLGLVLQRARLPGLAVCGSQLVFALTPANLESLGWSVQWSAVLAMTFLLGGLTWQFRERDPAAGYGWRDHVPLVLGAAASATCFSRGVLTGGVFALGWLLIAGLSPVLADRRHGWRGALFCLLPAVTVMAVIMLAASGNHQSLAGHGLAVLRFGATYLLLNPTAQLTQAPDFSLLWITVSATAKIAVVAGGLFVARGRTRHLLFLLLAYDLGNAVLLGIGRHHTGFLGALSSRYNYSSLVVILPFAGLVLDALLQRLRTRHPRMGGASVALLLCGLIWYNLRAWKPELEAFASWRGTEMRRLFAAPPSTDPTDRVPALEFMHVERAKALARSFNLH